MRSPSLSRSRSIGTCASSDTTSATCSTETSASPRRRERAPARSRMPTALSGQRSRRNVSHAPLNRRRERFFGVARAVMFLERGRASSRARDTLLRARALRRRRSQIAARARRPRRSRDGNLREWSRRCTASHRARARSSARSPLLRPLRVRRARGSRRRKSRRVREPRSLRLAARPIRSASDPRTPVPARSAADVISITTRSSRSRDAFTVRDALREPAHHARLPDARRARRDTDNSP